MTLKQWSIVTLQVEPHIGKEIGGHKQLPKRKLLNLTIKQYLQYCQNQIRPMLVISNDLFNRSGIIECMPIMTHDYVAKLYRKLFHKKIIKLQTVHHNIHGYIIPFQVLAYDFVGRHGKIADNLKISSCPQVIQAINNIFK